MRILLARWLIRGGGWTAIRMDDAAVEPVWPRKLTLDGHEQNHLALRFCGGRIRSGARQAS